MSLKVHPDEPGEIYNEVLNLAMGAIFLASGFIMGIIVLCAGINAKRNLMSNPQQQSNNIDTF